MLVVTGMVNAQQLSVHAGGSMLLGFTSPGPWGGIHIGLEVPRDDAISIYGRFTHHFRASGDSLGYTLGIPKNPADPYINVGSVATMDYNILEGGTRYYIGNGFDYGWAAYGGSCIMLVFNSEKVRYNDFDQSKYDLDTYSYSDGNIFSLGFGLGGGVKFSSGRAGTFYFDLNLAYMIFGQASSDFVSGSMYNPLIFNFNLGYRRDILW